MEKLTRGRAPQPSIIGNLKKLRRELLAAQSVQCFECLEGPRLGCEVCGGAGIIPPSRGIYDPSVMLAIFGMVISYTRLQLPDHCYELRTLLDWAWDYNLEATVEGFMQMAGSEHREFARAAKERLDQLGGKTTPVMRALLDLIESMPDNATRDEIVTALREAGDPGPDDGNAPVS